MPLPYLINATQVDCQSPIDEDLMGGIKADLDYLDGVTASSSPPSFTWTLNGPLKSLNSRKSKRIDSQMLLNSVAFSKCKVALERGGISGTLALDIRRHQRLNAAIQSINHQYTSAIQSIANVAPASATQSIARNGSQISTQSIARAKTQLNVQSIISVTGTNRWRFNLNTAPDSDWLVGKTFTSTGCVAGGNNNTFTIVEVNQSGHPSLVVTNASGVAQTTVAGNVNLNLWSYNQTNPVLTDDFTPNYSHVFASHATGANNGTFDIYKINQAGNNIWVFNTTGAAQAGVAGNVNTSFWRYNYVSAVSTTDFAVGEKAKMASHSTGANNGNFTIIFINYAGNNSITVYNTAGVAQGGVAGNLNTNRWIYAFSTNPSTNSDVVVGHLVRFSAATTPANNGAFTVVEVNRLGTNNLVVYNESGVAQAGVVGTVTHTRKIIAFSTDQSSFITTSSRVEAIDCPDALYNESNNHIGMQVLEVNRGGGANFNCVVQVDTGSVTGSLQSSPAGMITIESKSIFNSALTLAADPVAAREKRMQTLLSTDFVVGSIPENTYLGLWVTSIHAGSPESLTVSLS